MPGLALQTDAFVLLKRPPSDAFQTCSVFSAEHGPLLVLQRLPKKGAASQVTLDLFDEASLQLESSNQGQTWFVKEIRLLQRHAGIGRSYENLRLASAFAALVSRNRVTEESRAPVAALLRQVFAAFAASARPDVVYFKALYCFARDEGYPVRQQWLPTLPRDLRDEADFLLRSPVAALAAPADQQSKIEDSKSKILHTRLEEYLRGHTEILVD